MGYVTFTFTDKRLSIPIGKWIGKGYPAVLAKIIADLDAVSLLSSQAKDVILPVLFLPNCVGSYFCILTKALLRRPFLFRKG
ncbi:MAG: hypothetical protein OEV64_10335 [Desulfobulbaceae bacterium]|nr:hypothetical protein [Desulfobulbaceae bacterium]